jgi:2-polyprenyl-3-methyl-5-hydroxy-6-metoxy-1,4-benzoquinol methylase
MSLDVNHKWNKHTEHEIDVFIGATNSQNSLIFDVGCGNGRHSIELVKRNFRVVGIDFTENFIEHCKKHASEKINNYQNNLEFICTDIRDYQSEKKFDYAICLYDVIGSFASKEDNKKILTTIFNHLKTGGKLLISVMNGELSKYKSLNMAESEHELFEQLLNIKPSNTMEYTGNIFNPTYYIWCDGVVYRKEQFNIDDNLTCELIVRDRRYSKSELIAVLNEVGFGVIYVKYVKTGDWFNELDALDDRAKEILLFCEKN